MGRAPSPACSQIGTCLGSLPSYFSRAVNLRTTICLQQTASGRVLPVGTGRPLRNGRAASSATRVQLPRPPLVTRPSPPYLTSSRRELCFTCFANRVQYQLQAPADDRGFCFLGSTCGVQTSPAPEKSGKSARPRRAHSTVGVPARLSIAYRVCVAKSYALPNAVCMPDRASPSFRGRGCPRHTPACIRSSRPGKQA